MCGVFALFTDINENIIKLSEIANVKYTPDGKLILRSLDRISPFNGAFPYLER